MQSKITRRKGQTGKVGVVQCIQCGALVPRDKAIQKRRSGLPLSRRLRSLLLKQGAHLSIRTRQVHYCVSCAKHRKYV
jgi:small subunit ribosomal protein S26e